MNELKSEIKLSYIAGLRGVVLAEIEGREGFDIVEDVGDSMYLDGVVDMEEVKRLRSVARAYVVSRGAKYNPRYVSNHKSVLGNLIEQVVGSSRTEFKTFKITCAGSDSKEVCEIAEYVAERYKLREEEEADLKIHIIKLVDVWEVGVQVTPRPLSLRDYKVSHISGGMDPTVAYALNSLCGLEEAKSYLNIFSGSGTLLIEAGLCYPNLERLIGFDNDKKHLTAGVQNVKKAGLIRRVELKEADLFDEPDLGKFDVITSDLPFGMAISKDEDLERLYRHFIRYSEESLAPGGRLGIYTSEHKLIEKALGSLASKCSIKETLELKLVTSVDTYLRPRIYICEFDR